MGIIVLLALDIFKRGFAIRVRVYSKWHRLVLGGYGLHSGCYTFCFESRSGCKFQHVKNFLNFYDDVLK